VKLHHLFGHHLKVTEVHYPEPSLVHKKRGMGLAGDSLRLEQTYGRKSKPPCIKIYEILELAKTLQQKSQHRFHSRRRQVIGCRK